MKKITLSIVVLSCVFFVGCKKEVNEPENMKNIKSLVLIKKPVSKDVFDKDVFPLISELYAKDSVKYKMINHIANKAKVEKNTEIFNQNVSNLKEELKYY